MWKKRTYSCSNFVAISLLVLELLKNCWVRWRVGHPVLCLCIWIYFFCNKNWLADWNMCLMLLKVITFCSNTLCQGTFCCGAESLGFSRVYLNVWRIFNLASDEEHVTPYAQWTTRRNEFKFYICNCTGPLVRGFCNLLWSKAAYPKYVLILEKLRTCGGAVGWGTALQVGRSRVRFPIVSLEFFIDIILPATVWPWGRLSL